MSADYLFQRDKHYDVSYDTGDKVIQCGRHNDIMKFWLQWRSRVRHGVSLNLRLWCDQKEKTFLLNCFMIKHSHEQSELSNRAWRATSARLSGSSI